MNDPACPPPSWNPATRVAFRFSFVYLLLYLLMNGNATVFAAIPVVGMPVQGWFAAPGRSAAVWLGQHVFHLTGIAARWHGGGSGGSPSESECSSMGSPTLPGRVRPTALTGSWQVDSIDVPSFRREPASPEGQAWIALYIEHLHQGFFRSADGALWRCGFQYNEAKHTLTVSSVGSRMVYNWELSDPNHLRFTWGTGSNPGVMTFHRLVTPDHYALVDRGFRWVNEWGYER